MSRGGNGAVSLKGSSSPLPKSEPWKQILKQHRESRKTTIPSILANMILRRSEAINLKGQQGEGRDTRPTEFVLECPTCKAPKEVSKCTLYDTQAKILRCSSCAHSTSSSRWQCSHGSSWLRCLLCRELGFRCAGSAKRTQANTFARREALQKANIRRLRRLGPLGNSNASNSTSHAHLHIKNIKK